MQLFPSSSFQTPTQCATLCLYMQEFLFIFTYEGESTINGTLADLLASLPPTLQSLELTDQRISGAFPADLAPRFPALEVLRIDVGQSSEGLLLGAATISGNLPDSCRLG